MTTVFIIIGLLIVIFVLRAFIRNTAEQSGLNKCPRCHSIMKHGVTARYHCPICGYNR